MTGFIIYGNKQGTCLCYNNTPDAMCILLNNNAPVTICLTAYIHLQLDILNNKLLDVT